MLSIIQEVSVNTMNSTQLAEMLGYEKKEVNRKIKEMFPEKIDGGKIPPSLDNRGYVVEYNLPELESKMFVAKHDIYYLETITQYWIDRNQPKREMTIVDYARALVEKADEVAQLEVDLGEAIKTKAQISRKREASVMGKLGVATKKISKLEGKLQDVGSHLSIKGAGLPQRVDTPTRDNVQTFRLLKQLSSDMQLPTKKVPDSNYGEVLAYHVDVISKFKGLYL